MEAHQFGALSGDVGGGIAREDFLSGEEIKDVDSVFAEISSLSKMINLEN